MDQSTAERLARSPERLEPRPDERPAGRSRAAGWWPVVTVLGLIVTSDFQFRLRADDQAIAGNADLFVALEMVSYATVGTFLFLRYRPRPRLRRAAHPLTYLGYAYATVLVGSALYSPYRELAVVRAGQALVILALFSSIVRHTGRSVPHRIAHGYVLLVGAAVVFGVLVPFPRLATQPDRFTWLHVHPVQAGELLAIAVVLLAAYLAAGRLPHPGPHWPPPVYLGLLVVCAGGLVATKTRGAVLGAMVGITVVLLVRWRGSRLVEAGAIAGLTAAVIALSSSSVITDFFVRGESTQQLTTLNSRTELWSAAADQIAAHPLYGAGLAASRGLFLDRTGLGGGHNALVNVLVDAGLAGAVVWLALLVTMLAAALRLARGRRETAVDGIVVVAVLAGMVVNSVFTEELGTPANMAFTWLYVLLAWLLLARRAPETRPAPRP